MKWLVRNRWLIVTLVATTLLVTSAIVFFREKKAAPPSNFNAVLHLARVELAKQNYEAAEKYAVQALEIRPDSSTALMLAAEAATRRNGLKQALEYYARVLERGDKESVSALYGSGEILIHQGKLSDGEIRLRKALKQEPNHKLANYRLAFVLGITGRSWESIPYGVQLIRQKVFSVAHLLMLGDLERVVKTGGVLEKRQQTGPSDPLPQLGLARIALSDNKLDDAENILRKVLLQLPDDLEAHARLGEVLLLKGDDQGFSQWHENLPASAESHPVIWIVRGLWYRERKEIPAAIRCFIEAVSRGPNYRRANYQLGQLLQASHKPELAKIFLKRADLLQKLSLILDGFYRNWSQQRVDLNVLQRIVTINESLGRIWEAWAWTQIALKNSPRTGWAIDAVRRLQPQLRADLPRTLAALNPVRNLNRDAYPLPKSSILTVGSPLHKPNGTGFTKIQFQDRAKDAELRFQYFNSADKKTPGARIFETTGGGVAVLDYDGDYWPDLYFTQGTQRPAVENQHPLLDRLFRNLGNGRFEDVTITAGLKDADFSQGVTFGDFDNDGFPDLYIANIGRNRLYRNNGDGTFTDITQKAGLHFATWTTSCLFADLNGDGLSDLYDVNYIVDKKLSLICKRDGKPMSCSPLAYHAAQDRLLINRGDGRFEDVTETAGLKAINGYGLGVLAADFNNSGRLSLFVANDQTANHFFENRTKDPRQPRFIENGLSAGLATDADGKSQGCMGIAAGDANGDGRLDLFVTNFFNESNSMYSGSAGGLFTETSRRAGLRTSSFSKLGFGTQFLDGNLDGLPDLVVANGHIDDLTELNEPYTMSPQFFVNRGSGRFEELATKSLGGYFQKKWLGRGLARLDWNRDGREDFVVSHLQKNVALVTNETPQTGNYLAVNLRGISLSRDAIGTRVVVTHGLQKQTQQLTAGDGFHACNQRQLVFGLGKNKTSVQIEIHWPTGRKSIFKDIPANRELLIIEGQNGPLYLPRVNPSAR